MTIWWKKLDRLTVSRRAMQVILESGDYHMRHLLSEFGAGKGEALC
mgnify:CR=1 FL=1